MTAASCACPETSVLRELGLPLPRHHDCAYTAARTEHAAIAERQSDAAFGVGEPRNRPAAWTDDFLARMSAWAVAYSPERPVVDTEE
jgi:hypothetical protein